MQSKANNSRKLERVQLALQANLRAYQAQLLEMLAKGKVYYLDRFDAEQGWPSDFNFKKLDVIIIGNLASGRSEYYLHVPRSLASPLREDPEFPPLVFYSGPKLAKRHVFERMGFIEVSRD